MFDVYLVYIRINVGSSNTVILLAPSSEELGGAPPYGLGRSKLICCSSLSSFPMAHGTASL
uniref:Uncharacterized protein n=1 Tax=Oryza sativa subsp. japonica TaxID=39947 RepID=Q6Z1I6_ORYSJ|nr:hypothetical protein [Oryza sativa Japonica Group]BAD03586.1 hypothetical protein [Oryza sativa Japonica Group]